jgi:hypothetical protein
MPSTICYIVNTRVKARQENPLMQAIAGGSLSRSLIACDEYIYDLQLARIGDDG